MEVIKEALQKEAATWLRPEHSFSDWATHCMIDPSAALSLAYESPDMSCEDADEDEEFEDVMDELITEAFEEARK